MDKCLSLPSSELDPTRALREPPKGTELQLLTEETHFTGFTRFPIIFSLLLLLCFLASSPCQPPAPKSLSPSWLQGNLNLDNEDKWSKMTGEDHNQAILERMH